jgi:hypothetical protein
VPLTTSAPRDYCHTALLLVAACQACVRGPEQPTTRLLATVAGCCLGLPQRPADDKGSLDNLGNLLQPKCDAVVAHNSVTRISPAWVPVPQSCGGPATEEANRGQS